jgi:hypothetical protein
LFLWAGIILRLIATGIKVGSNALLLTFLKFSSFYVEHFANTPYTKEVHCRAQEIYQCVASFPYTPQYILFYFLVTVNYPLFQLKSGIVCKLSRQITYNRSFFLFLMMKLLPFVSMTHNPVEPATLHQLCQRDPIQPCTLFFCKQQQQQQQLSLLSQASWGRLEMKPTENKNKKHKKYTSRLLLSTNTS